MLRKGEKMNVVSASELSFAILLQAVGVTEKPK